MSRDQQPDRQQGVPEPADEPTTGAPAGAVSAGGIGPADAAGTPTAAGTPGDKDTAAGTPGDKGTAGTGTAGTGTAGTGTGAGTPGGRGAAAGQGASARRGRAGDRDGNPPGAGAVSGKTGAAADPEAVKRRRRRLLVAGIALAAAVVVVALCAGGLAVIRALAGFRDDASEAREERRLRDSACLELEGRLNRLTPPGATTTPQARAVAVRDENAATRIYVGRLDDQRVSDGWRELLDARTSFAEALDTQARSRTPAFFVAPAPRDGVALADQLARWSTAACAGPIRRLAAPDL